ncbi:hypothetical protein GMSM_37270 [Geomonas sp. Red276]
MALFRCNRCYPIYEDYYPTDDTCLKGKKGTVRIIQEDVCGADVRIVEGRSEGWS